MAGLLLLAATGVSARSVVSGRVLDTDGKPLKGVGVSDGIKIAYTNSKGAYRLSTDKKYGYVFVITPSGYVAPSGDGLTPDFYRHLSLPDGQPETVDFRLEPRNQDNYRMMVISDAHLTADPGKGDLYTFKYFTGPFLKNLGDRLQSKGPVYCVQLGDLTHDVYWYMTGYNLADAYATFLDSGFSVPTYSIPGNHENDGAVTEGDNTDFAAGHLYRKVLGPEYYSFNVGGDHYLMMDDLIFVNTPGEGKGAKGIRGKRDYRYGLTEDEMNFLRADLAAVPSSARVYLCVHAPIITMSGASNWENPDQVKEIANLTGRFRQFEVYSGHVHRLRFYHSDRYGIDNTAVCALSGEMWTTGPNKELGANGEDMGIYVASHSPEGVSYDYITRRWGTNYMRIYDMNAVSEYYGTDPRVLKYFNKKRSAVNYADPQFRDYVYINCWGLRPGYSLSAYENGRLLAMEKTLDEDPLYFISQSIPALAGPFHSDTPKMHRNEHMWRVKPEKPGGVIAVCLKDDKGGIVQQRMLRRPIAFGPDMSSDGSAPAPDVSPDTSGCQLRVVRQENDILEFEFSASHFLDCAGDSLRTWRITLYADRGCTEPVQTAEPVKGTRYTFTGLNPSSCYYCRVQDISDGEAGAPRSAAVRGYTERIARTKK